MPAPHPRAPSAGAAALPAVAPAGGARLAAFVRFALVGEGRGTLGLLADTAALVGAVVLALQGRDPWTLAPQAIGPLLVFPGVAVATLHTSRRSLSRLRAAVARDLLGAGVAVVAVGCLLGFVPIWLGAGPGASTLLAGACAWAVAMLCMVRLPLLVARAWARERGMAPATTLILGAGAVGAELARRLDEHPGYGLRPVGFLDGDPPPGPRSLPLLGAQHELAEVARRTGATHVLVAYAAGADRDLRDVLAAAETVGLRVSVVPRLFDRVGSRDEVDCVGGLPLVHLRRADPRGPAFAVKHATDRVVAGVALLLLIPALAIIALAVRLSSPGPVLFRQIRVGRDGRVFGILKFRTMRIGPGAFAPATVAGGRAPGGVEGRDRRTRTGRLLRASSLDELPQLLNVLRGEMSLVGPRPERPEFVELFTSGVDRYGERHRVRSGITGLAQVNGLRGRTRLDDRVRWDNWYIENWSLGLDLRILVRTLLAVLRPAE